MAGTQRLFEGCRLREALVGILGHTTQHNCVQVLGNVSTTAPRRDDGFLDVSGKDLQDALAHEGRPPGQEEIRERTEAIDVTAGVEILTNRLLG